MKMCRARVGLGVFAIALLWFSGCRTAARTVPSLPPPAPVHPSNVADFEAAPTSVTRTGYTVQVGAFSVLDNARRLAHTLAAMGLDAFYFPAGSGLYKVRFGNFPSREEALRNIREAVELYLEPVDDDATYPADAEQLEIAV